MSDAILLTNIGQLVTPQGTEPRRGRAMGELRIVRNAAVLMAGGKIVAAGQRRNVEKHPAARGAKRLDAGGRVALPGFVDSHTHLAFAGSRAADYEQRIAGATYEQIARGGGGILSTVRALRAASDEELYALAERRWRAMLAHGTTTLEAKSGYGLALKHELRTLRVYKRLRDEAGAEVISTFLGAHVVPPEYAKRRDACAELLIHKMIPQAAREGLAEFCDAFCDRGAFTLAETRRILTAARVCGMGLRIHAEQLTRTGSAALGVKLHAASVDHLECINAPDIRALAKSGVTCTLLPGCNFHLGLHHFAPARKLIDAGAIVALATDFNPGSSPTLNMQMVLSIACTQMRMTPAEAVTAATLHGAVALGRADRVGSIEPGKQADIALYDVNDYREIPLYFGVNHCAATIKRGTVAYFR